MHTSNLLSDATELVTGYAFRSSLADEPPGSVSVVAMAQSMGDSLTADTKLPQIRFSGDAARLRVMPGDVLFRPRGVSTQAIYVESVKEPCIFAAPLVRIRIKNALQIDSWYLHWVLNCPEVQRDINAQARGSIIRMVSLQSLRNLQIPVPPVGIQLEIVEVARLLRQERALSEALMEKNRMYAEKVLWAKAQEVR